MKYMIMLFGSQCDYDSMAGKDTGQGAWRPEDVAAMHEFMVNWHEELIASGELVESRGLAAPVHTRRLQDRGGVPVVTDGPYAETQEVLAGYTIVDCDSLDRATEIAMRITRCPRPGGDGGGGEYLDIRPIDEGPGPDL